jgi:hypothetical protein
MEDNIVSDETKMFLMMSAELAEPADEPVAESPVAEPIAAPVAEAPKEPETDEEMEKYLEKFSSVKQSIAEYRQKIGDIRHAQHDQHRIELLTDSLVDSVLLLENMFSLLVDMNNVLGATD